MTIQCPICEGELKIEKENNDMNTSTCKKCDTVIVTKNGVKNEK